MLLQHLGGLRNKAPLFCEYRNRYWLTSVKAKTFDSENIWEDLREKRHLITFKLQGSPAHFIRFISVIARISTPILETQRHLRLTPGSRVIKRNLFLQRPETTKIITQHFIERSRLVQ